MLGNPSTYPIHRRARWTSCELTNNEHDNPRQGNYTQKHEHRVFAFLTTDFLKLRFG